jgi:hypothetical protein
MESSPTGGKPEGKVMSPSQTVPSPSSSFILPEEFKTYANVFSPQMNCTLPPHRSMDISINLKEGAVPPFSGLHNLLRDEQQ